MNYPKRSTGTLLLLAALLIPFIPTLVSADAYEDALAAYDVDDYFKAHEMFLKAAEEGNIKAQFELGKLYYKGLGTKRDKEEGLRWMQQAAEAGNGDACNELGDLYLVGKGVEVDLEASTEWYRKAAEMGHSMGMYNLGAAYFRGREGAPQDYFLSYVWMKLAVNHGYRQAASYAKTIEAVLSQEDLERAKRQIEEMELQMGGQE